MATFFIARPVLAWVIAILIMLFGGLAMFSMPVSQFPAIAPPTINIHINWPGASAKTGQDSVVQVIEQQMNGLDNLEYMSSESHSDGSMTIVLTFSQRTNADTAQVQVQNKISLAQPMLPVEVQQQGIRVTKAPANNLLFLGFISKDGSMSRQDIADYVATFIQDPIGRTAGVGDFQLFGSPYAMRIWLDPAALFKFNLTATDVSRAVSEQNIEISSGQLGGLPAARGQEINATIQGATRLQYPEEFAAILIKTNSDGSQVRLGDVAKVELGAQNYAVTSWYNGEPAAGLAVRVASEANALDTAKAVYATLDQLRPFFPPGFEVVTNYDSTPFISLSIKNVVKTLIEAIVLVFVIMFLFLQNLRATLIPTLAIPVILLGTFGVLSTLGYSINTLTMFAMVLAIGLLVDDAIVVVENVERLMQQQKLSPVQATRQSMKQISGALFGMTMVLSAVFIPMMFFSGSTGVIYRQFAITIITAMVLSLFIALIFTPALCATLLKTPTADRHQGRFFQNINRFIEQITDRYSNLVGHCITRPLRLIALYILLIVVTVVMFIRLPGSFLPQEDQAFLFVQITTPAGSSAERTQQILHQASEYLLTKEKDTVLSAFIGSGFNFGGRGQNTGMIWVRLLPWEQRTAPAQHAEAVTQRLNAVFREQLRDANVVVSMPPSVRELGNVAGFNLQLMNQAGLDHQAFLAARNLFIDQARQSAILANIRVNSVEDAAQYQLVIDKERAKALGVPLNEINQTLSLAWGSGYINDFIDRGRVKRVYIQGQAESRMQPDDLHKWYVRNELGNMVPFSSFAAAEWGVGSQKLTRYNGVPAYNIQGVPASGYSSGDAIAEIERLAATLPDGVGYDWTGLSYEERKAGSQTAMLYLMSLMVIFLCLAGLYESWSIPSIVILAVPGGIIGTVLLMLLRGLANDVYFQIGLLTTIGLAAKNAILIVEFAKAHYDSGGSATESAMLAARQRLRPIVMTSLAFMLGVLPLFFASGAGAASQNAIGTAVLGGVLASTFLVIHFVPVFFIIITRIFRIKRKNKHDASIFPQV